MKLSCTSYSYHRAFAARKFTLLEWIAFCGQTLRRIFAGWPHRDRETCWNIMEEETAVPRGIRYLRGLLASLYAG